MASDKFGSELVQLAPSLKSFAVYLTNDDEKANDLFQETQYKALSNENKFTPGTNIKAWLFTIMKNIFINDYRRRTRRKTDVDNSEGQYILNSATSLVGNVGESNLTHDLIMNTINELSDIYRVPFLMHYQGYKYHEIAEEMELPLGTVKSRIFSARKMLKEDLVELNVN